VVFALVAIGSAPLRGFLLGLAVAAKFAPLVLAPLLLSGTRRAGRTAILAGAALAGTVAIAVLAHLPDGGLHEFWDATIGYQLSRESPFSIWGLNPGLDWLQTLVKAGTAALALALAFWPRERDLRQLAALAAAVIIALELSASHWFYLYIVWFAPLALAAMMAPYVGQASGSPANESRRLTSSID
jgi:hypothetical protein